MAAMLLLSVLTCCFFAAAWPILRAPMLCSTRMGAGRSCCVRVGSAAARLIPFDARTIKRRFVKDSTYHDEAKYSVGKMHESFALLQFDSKFRGELARRWNEVRAGSRLLQTGVVSAAALLLVASVFGY